MLHYLALIIFGFAFLLIILEAYDKSLIALSGALLMVVFRILTPTEAIEAIEFETILLLLAMMILVNIASKSGIFSWINLRIASLTRGNPLAIFLFFSLLTAVFSAFLDNVTTVILIVPLTIELVRGMGRDPKPYIFAEIIFSNIGGALTLVGDPPNIMIGGATKFSFLDFILNLWIPIFISTVLVIGVFILTNWKKLRPITDNLIELFVANILIKKLTHKFLKKVLHPDFVIKVISILVLTMVMFLLQGVIGFPSYVIAFSAAVLLAILTSNRGTIHEAFRSAEWTTLFFFAGLFIMVAGIEKTGVLHDLSNFVANSTLNIFYLSLLVLWVSGFTSMVIDNIPFVTVMIPVIIGIQTQIPGDTSILWWSLSLGACLGGNATLIGASANVVSADLARKNGIHISFIEYMKVAMPLTILVLVVCSAYLFFKTF